MAADDTSDQNRSGSRWEPEPGSTRAGSEEPTTTLASGDTEAERAPAPAAGTSSRRRRLGLGVPVAAAVATGLVLAGGLGGFVLGAATSGDELSRVSDGGTGDFHRHLDGRDGGPPGFPGAPPGLDGDDLPPGLDDDEDGEEGEDGDDEDPGSDDGVGADEDTGSAT